MQPTAYLIIDTERPEAPGALWHAGTIEGPVNGVVHPLYKRDDIAPLRVPLIDQHDTFVGYETRRPDDLLRAEGYRDDEGTIWTQPTAEAYARACAALHAKTARVEKLEGLLARVLDDLGMVFALASADALEEAQTLLEDR